MSNLAFVVTNFLSGKIHILFLFYLLYCVCFELLGRSKDSTRKVREDREDAQAKEEIIETVSLLL